MKISQDRLNMNHINSLPQPFFIRLCGDKIKWPLESIDVETGFLRFDVCGKLQVSHIGEVAEFIDADGVKHEPESFYLSEERAGKWQPIETAPKDGKPILLWYPHWSNIPIIAFWGINEFSRMGWISEWVLSDDDCHAPPIAWMPLPSPPEAP